MFGWLPSSTTPKAGKKQGNDLLVIKFVTFLLLNKAGTLLIAKKSSLRWTYFFLHHFTPLSVG
jgi:hypothetical protein